MRTRRGATALAGVLLVDKPGGMTSHDVVDALRRATGEHRVGHAGTLDPAATGLLVVLVGPYARLEPYLAAADKRYRATIAFGEATDTLDADGEVTATAAVPSGLFDSDVAGTLLATFVGRSEQVPPAYSAIKVDGRVAHRAARAGEEIELPPRAIEVRSARLVAADAETRTWDVELHVSKGTYVRSLARDVGERAGTVAHLRALRRTASGPLDVRRAHALAEVVTAAREARLDDLFTDPLEALSLPVVSSTPEYVANGRPLDPAPATGLPLDSLVAVTCDGELGAIYRHSGDALRPECVVWRPR